MVKTPDFEINLKKCEYIKRPDILVTSGSMWWDGDPYYIELVESRNSKPIISLANNTSDLEYSESEEIFGNLDEKHSKQIPDIYAAVISKVAEYQQTSREAILARKFYENKNIKPQQIAENQGKRQGPTMKEHEVKYGDDAGRGTQAVTEEEIKEMTIPDVVKHLGWETIKEFDNGEAFYGNHTPHGQNLYLFNIRKDHMAQDIVDTATASWRTEEELFRFWVSDRNNGMNSLTNDEIIADSKIAIQMYHLLADAVKMAERILQTEKVTDMNEFSVEFNDCEYDAETDTMRTTGKASFNGREYDVSFTEHDGCAPVINLSDDIVEMGYANGETIDGYGMGTHEWQDLYHAADTIYREMFDKADEFQRNDPDAICARISYESKDIDKSDIEVVSIDRNKGDIGELVGFVSINEDTLRFLADRDGNIMSLMPKGTPMQDVRTVPISDEVKCVICDAIHDGILEYNREAEIVSNAIVKEAEERGWSVRKFESGEMLLTNSTYGGGLLINAREDTLAQDIKEHADNFDVDQTMDMWRSARNKGVQGIPELNKDLEHDAKEARDMCIELSDAAAQAEASIDDHEIESERQTDDYER